ncbi:MAG: hypothetical protein Q3M24_07370 [Candidatus Electrothrix aestuarii]|uniref:Outer membrane protein beta-barrel domain-containing protein n=1 Tax=Candidatus Electrothrix aestuarii TaxID=3062594 RepID=A0AAU8LZF9_9BACT|nr:hypothetical protein [Candidatus Electrothrix aestuarii]WPD23516.1 MAG: hypothetical protein SD837_02925 [Candidatus Electrothrix sp. GW3-3]
MKQIKNKAPMQKLFISAMMFTVFWGISASRAEAISMGPYIDLSTGTGSLEWQYTGDEFDIDMNTIAVGFVLDTAALSPSFFNYRLNIGFEGRELEADDNSTLDLSGIVVENIFGFSLTQTPYYRWWVGPLLHFSAHSGDSDTVYDEYGYPYEYEYDFVQYGVGVVTGVNFMVNPYMTFSGSIGFRVLETEGTASINDYYSYGHYTTYYEEDLDGSTESFFLNLALLF